MKLESAATGRHMIFNNAAGNPVRVFPATGEAIANEAVNDGVLVAPGDAVSFIAVSTSQWAAIGNYT